MAQLLADENFPLPVVQALRALGHDVETMADAGLASRAISDPEVLAYATRTHRTVVTLNRKHFIRLHQESSERGGIVVCTFDPDFTGQADRLHRQIRGIADLSGQLVRVNRP